MSIALFVSICPSGDGYQFLSRIMGLRYIYFMYIHGIEMDSVYPSCVTPDYPRIDSEETMPKLGVAGCILS